MLHKGRWVEDFQPLQASDGRGGFVRLQAGFRNWVTVDGRAGPTGEAGFKAEPGRYHLYVALICPWASRTLMARALKGLQEVVSVSVLDPRITDKVWRFAGSWGGIEGAQADALYGLDYLYQLYLKACPEYSGRVTVPVLWDRQRETIVSNESADIVRMLNSGFGELADSAVDLYPQALQSEIDQVNEFLYPRFNNGVYRAGFATAQAAYEEAVYQVFESLAYIEERVSRSRFLLGEQFTETDIRSFVTLIRFQPAYYALFKTNLRPLSDYPAIGDYMRRIYALPGIAETVNIEHIKQGYYSIKALNPLGIVPVGPANVL